MSNGCEIWAVIPAAGIGKRMQSDIPKQYLKLNNRPVIEHTIDRLLSHVSVKGVVVSLQADDPYWTDINISHDKPVVVATGGAERCNSVMNALDELASRPGYKPDTSWCPVCSQAGMQAGRWCTMRFAPA